MSDESKQELDPRLDEVPKLPRAKLFGRMSLLSFTRIGMFGTLLFAIIVMRKPCADGVANFISGFDPKDAGVEEAVEGSPLPGYELITAEEALKRWPDRPRIDGGSEDAGSLSIDAAPEQAPDKTPAP